MTDRLWPLGYAQCGGMRSVERTKTQFARLLELDRRIRDGKYPNCLTFAAEWEVAQKTVQRDIDYLRDQLSAPIEYDRRKKGFFYSNPNWFLPSISLSEGDLLAILVASRALEQYRGTPVARELERVFAKIAEMLPDRITIRPELIFSRFSFTAPPAKPIDEKIWTTVVRGLLQQRTLEISYRSFQAPRATKRKMDPYHIANLQGEWYVFAWCHRADMLLQFSIPRIQKVALLQKTFQLPDDFDPEPLIQSAFGRFAGEGKLHTVRLLFDKEVAPWVLERQWHPKQKTRQRKGGELELTFPAAGLFEVMRWVLSWGRHVRVLAPEELQEQLTREEQGGL